MRQLRIAAIFLAGCQAVWAAAASGIEGDWSGVLNDGPTKLRTALHLARAADGSLSGTIDSVDQGAMGIPISKVAEDGRSLLIEIKTVGAIYDGQWSADGSEITGTFRQRGFDMPLTFRRGPLPELVRPQNPKKPYPYDAEDVVYDNPKTGNKLAGTLTLPRSPGPHPAVLLIPGSGAHDRDETVMGHKPFLIVADYLTRRGIAVLRVDDRGVGKSTGSMQGATTVDLAGDARASVDFLKSRKDIDPKQIGLIGHSEGGIIAPMLASQSADIAFIVMLGGPAVTGEETIVAQQYLMNRAMGMPEAAAERSREVERLVLDVVKQEADGAAASRKIHEGIEKMSASLPEDQRRLLSEAANAVDKQMATLTSPWYRAFLNYDPAACAGEGESAGVGHEWRAGSAGAAASEPAGDRGGAGGGGKSRLSDRKAAASQSPVPDRTDRRAHRVRRD